MIVPFVRAPAAANPASAEIKGDSGTETEPGVNLVNSVNMTGGNGSRRKKAEFDGATEK